MLLVVETNDHTGFNMKFAFYPENTIGDLMEKWKMNFLEILKKNNLVIIKQPSSC